MGIRILLFLLLLVSPCYGAELLVKANGHWMDELTQAQVNAMSTTDKESYEARAQKGDVIVVRPDGWSWGKEEGLPKFVVVKVPDMTVEEASKYEQSLVDTSDPQKPKIKRVRKYTIPVSYVDEARNNGGTLTRTKEQKLKNIKEKIGASSEISAPKTASLWRTIKGKSFALRRLILPYAYAATELKKTVKPSGGDYTSLEACMNGNEQDLTAADKYFNVEIDGDWSGGADTTAVTLHNYVTDSTRYIYIYTTTTARHSGKYDTAKYRLEKSLSDGIVFYSNLVKNVLITGIQSKNTNANTDQYTNAFQLTFESYVNNNFILDKCIGYSAGTTIRVVGEPEGFLIKNTILVSTGYRALQTAGSWSRPTGQIFYNDVFISGADTNAVAVLSYDATFKNCYAANGGTTATYSAHVVDTTCASDDGSEGTATVAYSTSSGAYFTNITAGSENFHIGLSSSLKDVGTDLSAIFTDDIDGDTRPTGANTWDIGADEYVSATTIDDTQVIMVN